MKKLLVTLLMGIGISITSQAQTSITIDEFGLDTLGFRSVCTNSTLNLITFGTTTGYTANVDSVYCELDYGDGTTANLTLALWGNGATQSFSSWYELSHAYSNPGLYNVEFIVHDLAYSKADTVHSVFEVMDTSIVDFSFSPQFDICNNSPVVFNSQISGIQNFGTPAWGFGDGTSQNWGENVMHLFAAAGDYTVTMTIDSNYLCNLPTTTIIKTVSVDNSCANFNLLSGRVYLDEDNNCTYSQGDIPLIGEIVTIGIGPNDYYVTTDSNGLYSVYLAAGSYSVTLPGNYQRFNCGAGLPVYNVTFAGQGGSSSGNDYALEPGCSGLEVGFSHIGYRPCFGSWYKINYKNTGFGEAQNAYIEITTPSEVEIVTTSLHSTWWNQAPYNSTPYDSRSGNTYTYNLGTVLPQETGSFYVLVDISCDAVLGQTLCTKLEIFPHDPCNVDSNWDKSSVRVEGACVGDSTACFVIHNTGTFGEGDMMLASEWRLYDDNVLTQTGNFQLNGGDSTVLCFTGTGSTLRLEADQRPGHPGNSHPRVTIELCGDSSGTLGLVNSISQDDDDRFVAISCSEVVGSWDPNDKQSSPTGNTDDNLITDSDRLKYKIRFQNTGTASAIFVKILDTLDYQTLDISTLRIGAASHPFSFRIFGRGIIEWRFDQIFLPDSGTNEPESHGFVEFTIQQRNGNPVGTIIRNSASIYFDFNEPVVTNETHNEVYEMIRSVEGVRTWDNQSMLVYPNPSKGELNIRLFENSDFNLKITDAMGRVVHVEKFYGNQKRLELNEMPAGLYLISVWNQENRYNSRIILK